MQGDLPSLAGFSWVAAVDPNLIPDVNSSIGIAEARDGPMLKIENLHATVDGKAILNGIGLALNAGRDPRDHGAERVGQVDLPTCSPGGRAMR